MYVAMWSGVDVGSPQVDDAEFLVMRWPGRSKEDLVHMNVTRSLRCMSTELPRSAQLGVCGVPAPLVGEFVLSMCS